MKLDARRAFIKSSKEQLGGGNKYTCGESSSWNISEKASQILEYAMWMQKGMEVERYRESIANPNSIPAKIFQWPWTQKVIQNSAATFKRVIGIYSLQPMLGTWIILITIDLI
jgi:hypothetical protein